MDDMTGTWQFVNSENENNVANALGIPEQLQSMIMNSPRPELTYERDGEKWTCITGCIGGQQSIKYKLGEQFEQMGATGNVQVTIDFKDGYWTEEHIQPDGKVVEIVKVVKGKTYDQKTVVKGTDGAPLASGSATYRKRGF